MHSQQEVQAGIVELGGAFASLRADLYLLYDSLALSDVRDEDSNVKHRGGNDCAHGSRRILQRQWLLWIPLIEVFKNDVPLLFHGTR